MYLSTQGTGGISAHARNRRKCVQKRECVHVEKASKRVNMCEAEVTFTPSYVWLSRAYTVWVSFRSVSCKCIAHM